MQQRLQAAEQLVQRKKYGHATKEFCWLWRNMLSHDPAMSGVRRSFMAGYMKRLADVSEHARNQFGELRRECAPAVGPKGVESPWTSDWIVLNSIVGDDRRTLRYLDSISNKPRRTRSIRRYPHHLKGVFAERKRWADVALLYNKPEAYIRWLFNLHEDTRKRLAASGFTGLDEMFEANSSVFRNEVGMLYAAHLLANDRKRARAIELEVRAIDWTIETVQQINRWSKRLGVIRPRHLKWLLELEIQSNTRSNYRGRPARK